MVTQRHLLMIFKMADAQNDRPTKIDLKSESESEVTCGQVW